MGIEDFVREHRHDDVRNLALGHHPEGIDMHEALVQIAGWQAAEVKLPEWAMTEGLLWPEHLPMEQCTSQYIAQYKAGIVAELLAPGFRMADLTGGLGVDCFYLSQNAGDVLYNDLNPQLSRLAGHNLSLLGRTDLTVSNIPAEQFLMEHRTEHFGLLYIDPARRSSVGRRLVSLRECQPDITQLQDTMLGISDVVMVKMSPMLDIKVALTELKCVRRLWILSLDGECKELLAVMQGGFDGRTEISAVDISADGSPGEVLDSTPDAESLLPLPLADESDGMVGKYICEPSSAYMKSGLFRTLCLRYGVSQLHPNSHLFISDECPQKFPGRVFRIVETAVFDRRSAKALFSRYPQANITVRNFPMTADEIRSRFHVRDGGNTYIFASMLTSGRKVLIVSERR